MARLLALLVDGLCASAVFGDRQRRRPAPRVGDGVESARLRFSLGIRGPVRAPCATPGEVVSQRGEGRAADGVPGGGVAGGGGGAGAHARSAATFLVQPQAGPSLARVPRAEIRRSGSAKADPSLARSPSCAMRPQAGPSLARVPRAEIRRSGSAKADPSLARSPSCAMRPQADPSLARIRALAQDDTAASLRKRKKGRNGGPSFPLSTSWRGGQGVRTNESERACHPERRRREGPAFS